VLAVTLLRTSFTRPSLLTVRKLAKTERPSSYGYAAKVLDLALKVYVYYYKMSSPAVAKFLMLRLNGAIEIIDKEDYILLMKVIRQDIRDSFDNNILPVQYDDIIRRRLNRVTGSLFLKNIQRILYPFLYD
jgi:hypothetical protein